MSATEKWAKFVAETNFNDIPKDAIEVAQVHLIDTIGVTLAGSTEPVSQIVMKHMMAQRSAPEATVIGGGFRTTAENAAFANGVAAHCMDYDDSLVVRGHPSSYTLPATLALGEKTHASGKAVIEAYIIGLEIVGRITAQIHEQVQDRGFHGTAILGAMGTCAAAAKILGLNKEQTAMAFGTAASAAAGLHKNRGTMGKSFHCGNGSRNGVTAALLAKEGFTSDDDILEGAEGYLTAFAGPDGYKLDGITDNLGKPFAVTGTSMSPGLVIKKYPCGFSFHWALDAALHLVKVNHIPPDDVANIEVGVRPGKAFATDTEVASRLKAKFSMEYLISAAVVDKQISRHTFDDDKVRDPKIRTMMTKVTLKEYPLPAEYPIIRMNPVTITMKDGKKYSHRVLKPTGYPDTPITQEQLLFKYRDCASVVLPKNKVEESVNQMEGLLALPDISVLMNAVIGSAK